jgi:hypothetical protein
MRVGFDHGFPNLPKLAKSKPPRCCQSKMISPEGVTSILAK